MEQATNATGLKLSGLRLGLATNAGWCVSD